MQNNFRQQLKEMAVERTDDLIMGDSTDIHKEERYSTPSPEEILTNLPDNDEYLQSKRVKLSKRVAEYRKKKNRKS